MHFKELRAVAALNCRCVEQVHLFENTASWHFRSSLHNFSCSEIETSDSSLKILKCTRTVEQIVEGVVHEFG